LQTPIKRKPAPVAKQERGFYGRNNMKLSKLIVVVKELLVEISESKLRMIMVSLVLLPVAWRLPEIISALAALCK
jgi:hypothetical protein